MNTSRLFRSVIACALATSASAEPVRFNRDIRPIMSDTCFHCHGFDAKTREAGLRLDIREEALKKAESGELPIVPGKPEESEIIRRIFAEDKDDLMPPVKAHKELTAAQKETVRRWVAEGAVYEQHWAYTPLVKPEPPGNGKGHPVDAFVRARLAEKKIAPSAEASPERLVRRLTLDLTGLPPTPEEVAAFLHESKGAHGAYERLADRLLASPRFGERMAVWWLDVARFADTVGFHGDQNQRIYPYRDYVIAAFNANKRFDQFTIEQLAGDLLPDPTPEQRVATGYNRLNMMTREGGAQPREYLAKYGAERVRSVAAAWFGSTFGCAECHDHKFDPIKAADFYSLQAFFADVKQWGVYADYGYTRNPDLLGFGNDHPFPPEIEVESPYLMARKNRAQAELHAHFAATGARLASDAKKAASLEQWVEESRTYLAANPTAWQLPPVSAQIVKGGKPVANGETSVGAGPSVLVGRALGKGETLRIAAQPGAGRVAAVRLQVEPSGAAKGVTAAKSQTLQVSASVLGADGKERKVGIYFADADDKEPRYSGGEEIPGVLTGWRLGSPKTDRAPRSVWLLDPPTSLAADDRLVVTLGGDSVRSVRIATSPFAAADPLRIAGKPLREALHAAAEQRTGAQRRVLAGAWLVSTAGDRAAFDRYKQLAAQVRGFHGGRAWSMVTEATEPLTVRVLPRGNFLDESGPVVLPSTPSFLPGRLESTPEKRLTRLDLARWIVSKENPITARTVMNRLWQHYFGAGLSAVIDDLGSQGEPPSHPELLDWLASEFRDSGWDVKHMVRLMVTSATYRQSSSLRPDVRDIDPANRLLASQNPRRLEAEFIRDNALAIAGVLNLADIGGPSVKPYQPDDYYDALQFPDRKYVASAGPEQWRRGLYMHWQRTFLHPMLANFDAPSRDECAAQRVASNTPQQALTLLNDPTFVEAARLLAARLLAPQGASDDERIRRAYHFALAREPKERELTSLRDFLKTQREQFAAAPDDAARLLKVGQSPPSAGDPTELAAWTSLCRVVLNSQEVITRY